MKSWNESDWTPFWVAKAGAELRAHTQPLNVMQEFQNGPSPYGQFTQETIRYLGLAVDISY